MNEGTCNQERPWCPWVIGFLAEASLREETRGGKRFYSRELQRYLEEVGLA